MARRSSTIVKLGSIDLTGRRVTVGRSSNPRREASRRASNAGRATRKQGDFYEQQYREEARERRAAAGPRHFYGAWTPPGMPASLGGHPGRALRKARHHAKRAHSTVRRAAHVSVPRTVRRVAHTDTAAAVAELEARIARNLRALGLAA